MFKSYFKFIGKLVNHALLFLPVHLIFFRFLHQQTINAMSPYLTTNELNPQSVFLFLLYDVKQSLL